MTDEVVPRACDRCGMPEHGSTSCEANRPMFEIEMETYEFEKAQELADEAGFISWIDCEDEEDES